MFIGIAGYLKAGLFDVILEDVIGLAEGLIRTFMSEHGIGSCRLYKKQGILYGRGEFAAVIVLLIFIETEVVF